MIYFFVILFENLKLRVFDQVRILAVINRVCYNRVLWNLMDSVFLLKSGRVKLVLCAYLINCRTAAPSENF